jgi:D-sedoheptulose 7-phosphate isomerase
VKNSSHFDQRITNEIGLAVATYERIATNPALVSEIAAVADLAVATLRAGNKILLCGNGGSAADAQHIAAEFVVRFTVNRPALPAIALTVDTSTLTACGNDFGFDQIFARQVQALGRPGDLLIGISTSGNSPNVLLALEAARTAGLFTVGLTGLTGGKMPLYCDHLLCAPSSRTQNIQEAHILIGHILCGLIEQSLFPEHFAQQPTDLGVR